jgi:hypothetical protein
MQRPMIICDNLISEVENFKYLRLCVQKDEGFGMDVKLRIKCGWMKWREVSGVLVVKRIPMSLKDKLYKRPTMLYGSECWAVDRRREQSFSVVEIRMLRWIRGRGRSKRDGWIRLRMI